MSTSNNLRLHSIQPKVLKPVRGVFVLNNRQAIFVGSTIQEIALVPGKGSTIRSVLTREIKNVQALTKIKRKKRDPRDRTIPTCVSLRPSDRKVIQAISERRKSSVSLIVTEAIAYWLSAQPEVIELNLIEKTAA